jgi:hypothetical protein
MKPVGLLFLVAILAGPAYGQTLTCGVLKAEASRSAASFQWTISGPSGKTTETGVLRSGPRFECIDGTILVVEFTSAAGHSVFEAYFDDGTNIGYGRQQIDRRGSRYVLPIQARTRIAAPFRGAFDYHCRLNMPADPIPPAARADCVF